MLSGGAVDLPERQRTIEAAIRWSYDLLTEPEQQLFARLSVFAGGARLEEIEAVCGPELPIAVLDGLATLVDQSLLLTVDGGGDSRFRMLHVIRQFAAVRLAEMGEEDEIDRRHLLAYIDLAEQASAQFKGKQRNQWLDRIARDHDNIRAALDWAMEPSPHGGSGRHADTSSKGRGGPPRCSPSPTPTPTGGRRRWKRWQA